MNSLHEYEAYLDQLDKHMYAKDKSIHIGFSEPYDVALDQVSDAEALVCLVREITLKLLEENVQLDYLAERFIRLSSKIIGLQIDPKALYRKHSIKVIMDTVLSEATIDNIRFQNGKGKFAGHHFIELLKLPSGKIRVICNLIGNPGHSQSTDVSQVQVEYLPTHVVLSLPADCEWVYSTGNEASNWNWDHSTRIALKHSFSSSELAETKKVLSRFIGEATKNA
jgi:hypothetical protein